MMDEDQHWKAGHSHMDNKNQKPSTRVLTAPEPEDPTQPLPPNRVLSVELTENQDIEWLWSVAPGGQRYVSGYNIIEGRH